MHTRGRTMAGAAADEEMTQDRRVLAESPSSTSSGGRDAGGAETATASPGAPQGEAKRL